MGARGETTLQVGDVEYRVLFTNRALAEAQATMSKGIIGVLKGFDTGDSGILDTAQLLAVGIEAARREAKTGGRAYTLSDAYRIMDEIGFAAATKSVVEAIAPVLAYAGEETEDENPKATAGSLTA